MTLPRKTPRIDTRILPAVLMLLVAAVFCRVATCNFVNIDDNRYVTDNPRVLEGLTVDNIAWAFGTDNLAGLWIPATWISLQVDASLSSNVRPPPRSPALAGAPPTFPSATIYHLDNLFLQMLAVACLFLALYRATRLRWPAFFVAAFWAIHPLRVESVAWVTERKDVLAGLFGFLAVFLYVHWTRRENWYWYVLSFVAMLLSTMAKPLFVTLPVLLVLLDYWPLARLVSLRELPRRLAGKWAFWIIGIAVSLVTVAAQHALHAVKPLTLLGIGERLSRAAVAYTQSIVRHVRVWDLAAYYPYGEAPSAAVAWGCGLLLLAITAGCIHQRRHRPWLLVGWLWFVVAMLPTSGLVQSGEQAYADRFTYLPSVGLFIMLVFTVWEIWQKFPVARRILVPAAGLAAVLSIGFTIRQIGFWHDTQTLGARTLEVTRDNWFMHQMMAIEHLRNGENEKADVHFRRAVELAPGVQEAWYSAGVFHLEWGKADLAVKELSKAAALRPLDARAHFYHGVALEQTDRRAGAILEYRNAAALQPHDPLYARHLRRAMQDRAALEEAIKYAPELKDLR